MPDAVLAVQGNGIEVVLAHMRWSAIWKIALRLALLGIVLVGINLGANALIARVSEPLARTSFMLNLTLALMWLAYVVLLAIPFVPSMEIGVSLLVAHGSAAAPFVYLGTLCGLMLAYGVGILLAGPLSGRFLSAFGLVRAGDLVDEIRQLSHEKRLERMQRALPTWLGRWIYRYRLLVLAALLNLPGNGVIGGGGGIALMAGMSRMFSPLQFFLTIALATAPVPILVWFSGAGVLG